MYPHSIANLKLQLNFVQLTEMANKSAYKTTSAATRKLQFDLLLHLDLSGLILLFNSRTTISSSSFCLYLKKVLKIGNKCFQQHCCWVSSPLSLKFLRVICLKCSQSSSPFQELHIPAPHVMSSVMCLDCASTCGYRNLKLNSEDQRWKHSRLRCFSQTWISWLVLELKWK